jgi:5-methyltetrahydrofolate--homocysteine methyltransferase
MANDIREILNERILILDGAMGTMIQSYHLTEQDFRGERFADLPGQQQGNNELLTLTRPDVIRDIHRRYLTAGADIIETNTFNAQRISMQDYHCSDLCRRLNIEAARLARSEADRQTQLTPERPRFVAGSIGPTNKTCSISADVTDAAARAITFDALLEAYKEQVEALMEGGVDLLLIETIFDTLNAKAALMAAEQVISLHPERCCPIMLSVTIADKAGRTLSGQTLRAFVASIDHSEHILSIGLNCSFGASDMKPFLQELSQIVPYYISAYPNAGLPNALGDYDQTPQQMAKEVKVFIEEKLVNIVGGCCGTTDSYIAEYPALVRTGNGYIPPRRPASPQQVLTLAGLEPLCIDETKRFTVIGERCNVAGSRKFLRLIKEKQYEEATDIARRQIEAGADVIDINLDDGLLDTEQEMTHFVNLLAADPDICRVPFMIDSSRWDVIRAALKCIQGKCIVNSISLKEGEETFLAHARELRSYGAAVVVMAFDEKGQADTYERKVGICQRSYRLLTEEAGIPPEDIIFDPNILAICTGMAEHDHYGADFISATRWIRTHLPMAHVSGGVSNLSFSFRGNNYIREAMHAVFLHHAIEAGMDFGIVNPTSSLRYEDIPTPLRTVIEDVILARRPATEELIALASELAAQKRPQGKASSTATSTTSQRRDGQSVEERLADALRHGVTQYLEEDITEALQHYPHALDIIEGPLMSAMNQVGQLFGEGKMFLPQVVKTARTMKQAVGILSPHIEAEKVAGRQAGRIIMATVKGDVHDIGKNIVAVVLACNNYEVIDLGVMCPAEDIVETALKERPDFIGLSGLITPSLDEMVATATALAHAGVNVPLLIGGATTSELHTALKIAPAAAGPVIWVKDASQMVLVAAQLMGNERQLFLQENETKQQQLRQEHAAQNAAKEKPLQTLSEARANKMKLF